MESGPDRKKLLIADGDKGVRDALQAYLTAKEYDVYTCGNADDALDLSRGGRYDVIIADCHLPRVDGLRFIRRIREQCPDALLIATCNLDPGADAVNKAECILMQKPIIPSDLMSVLKNQ